jgi:hypothetical protein
MNRNEAKAYALNELGLDRDTVRQFGNLSRTQTWLDAIAAQASGGIAAQEEAIAAEEEAIAAHDDEIATHKDEIAPCQTMIVKVTPAIAIPEPATQDTSFESFWDSAPALLQPQPLLNISVLDGDWDEPEPPASQASEVIIYPIVIGLLLLWAIVQLLLLAGRGIAQGLTTLANALDAAARHRLQAEPSRLAPQLGLRKTTLVLG